VADVKKEDLGKPMDFSLWDLAGWQQTVLAHAPEGVEAPFLGPLFLNERTAKRAFELYRKRVGQMDAHGELRVAIIEGEIPGEAPGYTVHIAPSRDGILARAKAEGLEVDPAKIETRGRTQRMTPPAGSTNLSDFRREYEKHGRFLLMPAFRMPRGELSAPFELAVALKTLHFRRVEDVRAGGEGDPDAVVIAPKK